MAIRPILRLGNPVLREVSAVLSPEDLGADATRRLVDDMIDTLHDAGGIGLAAPQIGELVRLAIIEIPGGPTRYGDIQPMPLSVFANPVIEVMQTRSAGYWEGCLSVPGLRGFVERPQHIRVRYQSLDGEHHTLELEGFLATVFQHEFDHLDGRLYIDRMTDMRNLTFEEEFEQFHMG